MDKKQKEEVRIKIIEGLESCDKEIERLIESAKPVAPDNSIGRLTRMEAMQAQKMAETNLAAAKNRRGLLKAAQSRVDEEAYGVCIECGEDIPFKRLVVLPYAVKCVQCLEN